MLTSRDYKMFNLAKTLALSSSFYKYKIGCVVVLKKHIISVGVNSYKTHPIQKYYNKLRFPEDTHHTLHAEIHALVSIPDDIDLSDATVYTYRESLEGNLRKSRPCPSCMGMIKDHNIHRICYTTDDGYCEEILLY